MLVKCVQIVGLIATLSSLRAQSDRGTIEGSLSDATGAAVPAAQVLVVQIETNHTFEFTANELGRYFAANLPSGRIARRASVGPRRNPLFLPPEPEYAATRRSRSRTVIVFENLRLTS